MHLTNVQICWTHSKNVWGFTKHLVNETTLYRFYQIFTEPKEKIYFIIKKIHKTAGLWNWFKFIFIRTVEFYWSFSFWKPLVKQFDIRNLLLLLTVETLTSTLNTAFSCRGFASAVCFIGIRTFFFTSRAIFGASATRVMFVAWVCVRIHVCSSQLSLMY